MHNAQMQMNSTQEEMIVYDNTFDKSFPKYSEPILLARCP
jgi:hypothetical protein